MKKSRLLILGGSSDIGIELYEKLIKLNKYEIFLHTNSNTNLVKNKKECKIIVSDFTKLNQNTIIKKFKNNYDIIINLVGYISSSSFINFKITEFYKTINANSLIPMIIIRKSLSHMKKNKFGRILNTSSVGVKFGGSENTFLYSLSKYVNEFIPSYIKKLSSHNVFYNCVRIGVVNTKIHKKIKNKNLDNRAKLIPVGRLATKEEIVSYIIYLIDNNTFITNEVINITGGE